MTELLHRHKQRLGTERLDLDRRDFLLDVVPSMDSEAVQAFAAELSPLPPVLVPMREDEDGVYGWPADGVRAKIGKHGGSIQFGWRLREWPGVLLTAEFHAVWVDPEGTLVDITPAAIGVPSLFVPDPTVPETFDAAQWPPSRYKVLHTGPDLSKPVAARIAQMKPAQRAYEERRAAKAGQTLDQWIRAKFPADPLLQPIAAFVDACQAFEARLPELPDLIESNPVATEDAIVEPTGPGEDAAEPVAIDPPAPVDIDDAHDEPVSAEEVSAADPDPADASDSPADASAEADGETGTTDDPDDDIDDDFENDFDDTWTAENETYEAIYELRGWATPRYNRRRAILRLIPDA
jgi:hypothetical protein